MQSSAPTDRRTNHSFEPVTKPMGQLHSVTPDLTLLRTAIANLYFYGPEGAGDRNWVLIDAGVFGAASRIREAAADRFGGARPAAIILTHGHFDHVGAVRELSAAWDAPVFAHPLELPYLTGRSLYPPADPTVQGGAMATLSFVYPRGPIDLGATVHRLPQDGSVPGMPGWRWIHTPGHAPGHVALFREADRVLIAGDAFVTTDQESLLSVLSQKEGLQGPPAYFTPDWNAAEASVRELAALEPEIAVTGHGLPMDGTRLRNDLHSLAANFQRLAMPESGRYVGSPAIMDQTGVVWVPPRSARSRRRRLAGVASAALLGAVGSRAWVRRREQAERRG